jgi:hypothetical protein
LIAAIVANNVSLDPNWLSGSGGFWGAEIALKGASSKQEKTTAAGRRFKDNLGFWDWISTGQISGNSVAQQPDTWRGSVSPEPE